jgi:hypothetical protein
MNDEIFDMLHSFDESLSKGIFEDITGLDPDLSIIDNSILPQTVLKE